MPRSSPSPTQTRRRNRLSLPERWAQLDALRALHARRERPVTAAEIATELGIPVDHVSLQSLSTSGYALRRRLPGGTLGLVPTEARTSSGLVEALAELRRLPPGTTIEWVEGTRRGHEGSVHHRARRQSAGAGAPRTRRMTVSASYRSHVISLLRRAKERLGLRSLRAVSTEQIALLLEQVWRLSMEASLLPTHLWDARTPEAQKARDTASKRRGDVWRWLLWAEHAGYVDLRPLHSAPAPLAPRPWAEWLAAGGDPADYGQEMILITHAVRLGADGPERLVECGFERLEERVLSDTHYQNRKSAKRVLTRMQAAWNRRLPRLPHLPGWATPPARSARREDGSLQLSWWSADAVVTRRAEPLLDRPEMAIQRQQAADLRDWWTLEDPTLRPASQGGPLPPCPQRTHGGRWSLGARDEQQTTALRPLQAISRLQRFALDFDAPEHRIPPERMQTTDWQELLRDRALLFRYIRHEFDITVAGHGKLVRSTGYNACYALHSIVRHYYPARCEAEIKRHKREMREAPDTDEGYALRRALDREIQRLEAELQEWEDAAEALLKKLKREENRCQGVQEVKPKDQIAQKLDHAILARLADHHRDCRLALAAEFDRRTERLVRRREQARARPCEHSVCACRSSCTCPPCGELACDVHSPVPRLTRRGRAEEVITRTYCTTAMYELALRLPGLVPWRPQHFRLCRLGIDLLPDSLFFVAAGGKVERDREQQFKREEVDLPSVLPLPGMPEDATERVFEILRVVIEEVQPWLVSHPTATGERIRQGQPDLDCSRYLILAKEGTPYRTPGAFGNFVTCAVETAAREINRSLGAGEEPIDLPEGTGLP